MLTRYCLLDLETVAADDCRQWLGTIEPDPKLVADLAAPIKADSRLVDPAKIAADLNKKQAYKDELPGRISEDIAKRTAAALEAAPLDPDLNKIVCFGVQPWNQEGWVRLALNETDERHELRTVWSLLSSTCPMVGFGVSFFDAGVLVRRSQLLGVPVPPAFYNYGKYHHDWIVDLADRLTLNGRIDQKKGRGLEYHCQRFGIQVEDACTGADIAGLWAEGDHQTVMHHCLADLTRIQRLAERLGVIPEMTEQQPELTAESAVL